MKEGRIFREREPIGIRRKEFWSVDTTEYLVGERFQKKLGHEPDGLIFQPINDVRIPNFLILIDFLSSYLKNI